MIDFIFDGTISVDTNDKETFIRDFNEFLRSKKASLRGSIRTIEFENAEIVND